MEAHLLLLLPGAGSAGTGQKSLMHRSMRRPPGQEAAAGRPNWASPSRTATPCRSGARSLARCRIGEAGKLHAHRQDKCCRFGLRRCAPLQQRITEKLHHSPANAYWQRTPSGPLRGAFAHGVQQSSMPRARPSKKAGLGAEGELTTHYRTYLCLRLPWPCPRQVAWPVGILHTVTRGRAAASRSRPASLPFGPFWGPPLEKALLLNPT
jgi:hypothetical protein